MSTEQIVKKLHDELHWSMEKIGEHTGGSADMVRRWRRGENEPTGHRRQKLYKLAEKHITGGDIVTSE